MNFKFDYHKARIIPVILITLFLSVVGCDRGSESIKWILDSAELLMENRPDSALAILDSIGVSNIKGNSQKARYSLLKSMALDKNYIDTTTFDILQPAIDYYIKNGTPDEKLRTYYYKGRIYQNRNERDSALSSFIKGLDNTNGAHDSLTIARTLVAQGIIYNSFYDLESYTSNHLQAARIYQDKALDYYEFDCLMRALSGMIILENKERADSIINIIDKFNSLGENEQTRLRGYKLAYLITFGSSKELEKFILKHEDNENYNVTGLLNLALAYNKLGNNKSAIQIFNYIDDSRVPYDTLKYLSIKYRVLEDVQEYEHALTAYKGFVSRLETINFNKFDQKSKSVAEKHALELQAERDARIHSNMIFGLIGGITVLVLCILVLTLLVRSNKNQKMMALEKNRMSELENEKLKTEREKLSLENANLQLERDKKAMEAENLTHRVETLENESESLKTLLDTQEEIPAEVQEAIRTRIEMLNSLLAGYITDNSKYVEPYDMWVKQLTENTEEFMNSNRLAFQASHPRFIRYFEDHGLTESEINYVCLYAIGLRGKEVGNYMKKRSHVNISSAIRKKLGIDKHDTNIGIYVRKILNERL